MAKYLDDLLFILGCVLICIGVYQINPVLVWFAAGIMLIGMAFMLSVAGRSKKK